MSVDANDLRFPSRMNDHAWSGLLETADRFGSYSWVEMRMFQVFGSWATTDVDPRLTLMFDDHARRHSWHSTLWFDRLPELSNVEAPALVRPPSDGTVDLLDDLAALTDPLERLTAGYEVFVAHLIAVYRRELVVLDSIGDASTRHWLKFILQNLTDELLAANSQIHDLVMDDSDLDSASAIRREFQGKLLHSR